MNYKLYRKNILAVIMEALDGSLDFNNFMFYTIKTKIDIELCKNFLLG